MRGSSVEALAWFEGRVCPAETVRIGALDRSFLYGDSVFEVFRTYGGKPCQLEAHVRRLEASAARLRFVEVPPGETLVAVGEALSAAAYDRFCSDVYVRLLLSRGSGPIRYQLDDLGAPMLVGLALPLTPPDPALYRIGAALRSMQVLRPADNVFALHTKSSNYLPHIMALDEARRAGADDALILGPQGEVLEGSTSNVFWAQRGELFTPTARLPILDGITRQTVLACIERAGFTLHEGVYFPTDIYAADEVFITSSIREVLPITVLDGRPVGQGAPGPFSQHLLEAYRSEVHA